jgi:predicted double-glycine peptidase
MKNKTRLWYKLLFGSLTFLIVFFFLAHVRFGIIPWTSFVAQSVLEFNDKQNSVRVLSIGQNRRQTSYDCGAFNIATVLNALDKKVDFEEVVEANRKKMIPHIGVVPEVLVSTLKKYGAKSKARTFRWMNEDDKISTLKTLLAEGKPIIVLIKRHGYLHFVLLTGFENEIVSIYDPLLDNSEIKGITIDRNGEKSGNDSMAFSELIDLWNDVHPGGFYKSMAIIIEPNS